MHVNLDKGKAANGAAIVGGQTGQEVIEVSYSSRVELYM